MANSDGTNFRTVGASDGKHPYLYLAVLLFSSVVYLGCIVSPPSLLDDVDAVQAQIARNMLTSGDWVTPHLDKIPYLEKAPLLYWMVAASYKAFGVTDWAARIPLALTVMALCCITAAFGVWAFGRRAGFYAGLCMSTCVGLFLFTRILNPDAMLTLSVTLAMWAFLRALDAEEAYPRLWSAVLAISLAAGLLLKSLIAVVFPIGAGLLYLLVTRQLLSSRTWKRLHPFSGLAIVLLLAAPWHILATLRNPPYFAFTLHSGPGQYHGFFWFFFINEQLLRFLNLRYPRDYNTVPRVWFWLLHLVWLFPWSVYLPAVARLSFRPVDRAGKVRLLALCWIGFVLLFFTFSTTQEYYSMPCYAAFALLLGSAMAADGDSIRRGTRVLAVISACAAIAILAILIHVRSLPTPGDISGALSRNPSAYTLSLGHMLDLTLDSFAYLRTPLIVAGVAFLIGTLGTFRATGQRAFLTSAFMMVVFFHAARLALVVFDPYLSSRTFANMIIAAPPGTLIVDRFYYTYSSVFFYTGRDALLLNGRIANMEYGSNEPGAPQLFIDEEQFKHLWLQGNRYYLVTKQSALPHFEALVGMERVNLVGTSGGKVVLTNSRGGPTSTAAAALSRTSATARPVSSQ